MHRTSDANKSVDKFGVGKHGFTEGDKTLGVEATKPGETFFDVTQEEIANSVEGAGITLSVAGGNYAQLLDAIGILGARRNRGIRVGTFERTSNSIITLSPSIEDKVWVEIDGRIYEASSATWDNTTDFDTGSVASNTIYYLYALVTGGSLDTKISATAPSTTGKVGYHPTRTSERFVFAMRTKSGSAVWEEFSEIGGFAILRTPLTISGLITTHSATYVTALPLTGVPATARLVRCQAHIHSSDLTVHYGVESMVGLTASSNPGIARFQGLSGNAIRGAVSFDLPVDSTPTITWGSENLGGYSWTHHSAYVHGWRNQL